MLKQYATKIETPAHMVGSYYCIVVFNTSFQYVDEDCNSIIVPELWAVSTKEELESAVNCLKGVRFGIIKS
jgi:hypothetical protein